MEAPHLSVFILHGSYGSPDGNWFPWLKEELEACGIQVYLPKLPTPEAQSLQSWKEVFQKNNFKLNNRSIVIGHSISALFALHLIDTQILGAALVSGFINPLGIEEFDSVNKTFLEEPLDWKGLKRNAGEIMLLAGDNDPYVPLENTKELASKLETPLTIIPHGGHLNAESGYTEFPLLKDWVLKFI